MPKTYGTFIIGSNCLLPILRDFKEMKVVPYFNKNSIQKGRYSKSHSYVESERVDSMEIKNSKVVTRVWYEEYAFSTKVNRSLTVRCLRFSCESRGPKGRGHAQ